MQRTLTIGSLATALTLSSVAAAAPSTIATSIGSVDAAPTIVFVKLAAAADLPVIPPGLLDRVVHWELDVRDLVHGASDRIAAMAALADHAGVVIPDLTVLTTEPIANSESSGFGWREDPIRHTRRYHGGADFRGKYGTPVVAAGDGVVIFAGRQGGYGNVIYVDHGGGVVTRYGHLSRIDTKRDASITAGQKIGQVGATGRATGPHLHFEVRLDGRAVNPITAMEVASLERESPRAGQLAAYALAPDLQAAAESDVDPPKHGKPASRPERPARAKRTQNLW